MIASYLKKLKQNGIERNIPNISENNAKYIGDLLLQKNPKHILEIGSANGYSGLYFHFILPKDVSITTIEYAWNAHNEAVEHFKNCKAKNIFAIWGDAKKVIPLFQEQHFDVVYIDAMKKEYLDYLLLAIPKLRTDGLIILDDVEKFSHKMPNLYDWLAHNNVAYTLHKTDEDDSIMTILAADLPPQKSMT